METTIFNQNYKLFTIEELISLYNSTRDSTCNCLADNILSELKNRDVDMTPIKGGIPSKIKLVDNVLWNGCNQRRHIIMMCKWPIFDILTFMLRQEEIKDKDFVMYQHICNSTSFIYRPDSIIKIVDKKEYLLENEVFMYYKIKDKVYPEKIPFKKDVKRGYYIVFDIVSNIGGNVTLYNQNDEVIRTHKLQSGNPAKKENYDLTITMLKNIKPKV